MAQLYRLDTAHKYFVNLERPFCNHDPCMFGYDCKFFQLDDNNDEKSDEAMIIAVREKVDKIHQNREKYTDLAIRLADETAEMLGHLGIGDQLLEDPIKCGDFIVNARDALTMGVLKQECYEFILETKRIELFKDLCDEKLAFVLGFEPVSASELTSAESGEEARRQFAMDFFDGLRRRGHYYLYATRPLADFGPQMKMFPKYNRSVRPAIERAGVTEDYLVETLKRWNGRREHRDSILDFLDWERLTEIGQRLLVHLHTIETCIADTSLAARMKLVIEAIRDRIFIPDEELPRRWPIRVDQVRQLIVRLRSLDTICVFADASFLPKASQSIAMRRIRKSYAIFHKTSASWKKRPLLMKQKTTNPIFTDAISHFLIELKQAQCFVDLERSVLPDLIADVVDRVAGEATFTRLNRYAAKYFREFRSAFISKNNRRLRLYEQAGRRAGLARRDPGALFHAWTKRQRIENYLVRDVKAGCVTWYLYELVQWIELYVLDDALARRMIAVLWRLISRWVVFVAQDIHKPGDWDTTKSVFEEDRRRQRAAPLPTQQGWT